VTVVGGEHDDALGLPGHVDHRFKVLDRADTPQDAARIELVEGVIYRVQNNGDDPVPRVAHCLAHVWREDVAARSPQVPLMEDLAWMTGRSGEFGTLGYLAPMLELSREQACSRYTCQRRKNRQQRLPRPDVIGDEFDPSVSTESLGHLRHDPSAHSIDDQQQDRTLCGQRADHRSDEVLDRHNTAEISVRLSDVRDESADLLVVDRSPLQHDLGE
jgi:hypothetical protein